jgi:hypothetical protein
MRILKLIIMLKNLPLFNQIIKFIRMFFQTSFYVGRHPSSVSGRSIIFFPYLDNLFCCGLTSLVYIKKNQTTAPAIQIPVIENMLSGITDYNYINCTQKNLSLTSFYLGKENSIDNLLSEVRHLKDSDSVFAIFDDNKLQKRLVTFSAQINRVIDEESKNLHQNLFPDLKKTKFCLS